jgi:hypothetical protein
MMGDGFMAKVMMANMAVVVRRKQMIIIRKVVGNVPVDDGVGQGGGFKCGTLAPLGMVLLVMVLHEQHKSSLISGLVGT